jgi:hypothetical protein
VPPADFLHDPALPIKAKFAVPATSFDSKPAPAAVRAIRHPKPVAAKPAAGVRPREAVRPRPAVVRVACRAPSCRGVNGAPGSRQASHVAPAPPKPVPRLLVPVRNLGLWLQARLAGGAQERTADARRTGRS